MRILEIASAEEQLALFKLVNDSVWQALAIQQKQQADERVAKQVAAKSKPKKSLRSKLAMRIPKATISKVAPAHQRPIPKPAKPAKPQQQAQAQQVQPMQQQATQQQFVQKPPRDAQIDVVAAAEKQNGLNGRLV
jgi:hypothetical protein